LSIRLASYSHIWPHIALGLAALLPLLGLGHGRDELASVGARAIMPARHPQPWERRPARQRAGLDCGLGVQALPSRQNGT
jgi:hypothetical protein